MEQSQRELEGADSLDLSDGILPSQFFGAMGGGGLCSEQLLMLAVLVDAINILQGWHRLGSARKRRAFAEAGQWVNTRGTHYPFTFDSICDALSIDPDILRQRLSGLIMGRPAQPLRIGRLRIKESNRSQHMTASRVRRRRKARLAAVLQP